MQDLSFLATFFYSKRKFLLILPIVSLNFHHTLHHALSRSIVMFAAVSENVGEAVLPGRLYLTILPDYTVWPHAM